MADTDCELLERAALAAGLVVWAGTWPQDDMLFAAPKQAAPGGKVTGVEWNPLTDDGDALRLAVKLRMDVEPWIHGDSACARVSCQEVLIDEPHYGDDPERATRRAIVRTAGGRPLERSSLSARFRELIVAELGPNAYAPYHWPSLHECRSLSARTFKARVKTQDLLGHKHAEMTAVYEDDRGLNAAEFKRVEMVEPA